MTKTPTGNVFLDSTPRQQFVEVIMSYFSIESNIAEVIAEIIDDEFDNIDKAIEAYNTEVMEELVGFDAVAMTSDEYYTAHADKLRELIEAYMLDFQLDEDRGYSGDIYELTSGRCEYHFGDDDAIDKEAEAACESLLDEMIHEPTFVKEQIVPSWSRGQTRDEWIEENAERDNLASYDGNTNDFTASDRTSWVWYRVN